MSPFKRRTTINEANKPSYVTCNLLLVSVLMIAFFWQNSALVSCSQAPAQSAGSAQQQRNGNKNVRQTGAGDSLQQDPLSVASSSRSLEFSPPEEGMRPWFYSGPLGSPNTKRARKMSAFMPMRGRRAGPLQLSAPDASPLTSAWFRPDKDDSQLANFYNLVAALAPEPQMEDTRVEEKSAFGTWPLGWDDFRFALQNPQPKLQQQQQREQQQQLVERKREADDEPAFGAEQLARSQQTRGGGGGGQLVESKARRAFYPMRGKKSLDDDSLSAVLEQEYGIGGASWPVGVDILEGK